MRSLSRHSPSSTKFASYLGSKPLAAEWLEQDGGAAVNFRMLYCKLHLSFARYMTITVNTGTDAVKDSATTTSTPKRKRNLQGPVQVAERGADGNASGGGAAAGNADASDASTTAAAADLLFSAETTFARAHRAWAKLRGAVSPEVMATLQQGVSENQLMHIQDALFKTTAAERTADTTLYRFPESLCALYRCVSGFLVPPGNMCAASASQAATHVAGAAHT